MQIIRHKEVLDHKKLLSEGEERYYYCPSRDPFEIIETIIYPGTFQTPHAHEVIREATLVLEGKIIVAEIIGGKRMEEKLGVGDLVVFDPGSCHTMENHSNYKARTLTIKFLGKEKDVELFATDKLENCRGPVKFKTAHTYDQRYAAYVEVYNNLDRLLWQVPAFLVAASVFGFGLFDHLTTDLQSAIPLFNKDNIVGIIFLLWGVLYLLGVYSIWRLRKHHTLMGEELANLEPAGYFHKRKRITKKWWPPSAPHMFMVIFSILALLLFVVGMYNILCL